MKTQKLLRVAIMVVVGLFSVIPGTGIQAADNTSTDALSREPVSPPPFSAMGSTANGPIIIDHTNTDLSQIPAYWLEEAKKLTFHYAHTSHGSQIISGITKLEQVDPTYGVAVLESGNVGLPSEIGVLRIYDGNNIGGGNTYITPELYWSTPVGIAATQSVADWDGGRFNDSMWSWCGQQSSNSEATVQQYLDTITALETQYPNMRFILMTGHTDGGSATLARNNNMVRQYALDHNMVLFDFADIETYDPLGGGPYVNNSEGTCTWCATFCGSHPQFCTDLPDDCAHTDNPPEARLFCKLKGNAFWWMMARLAGWEPDGPPPVSTDLSESNKTVSPAFANAGDPVTYTVSLRGHTNPLTSTVLFTDTVPTGVVYVPGTLSATSGIPMDAQAPILLWSGTVSPTLPVTITYSAVATPGFSGTVTNTAYISAPEYGPITRIALLRISWYRQYLPLVMRVTPF